MGTWGYRILEDDFAADVSSSFVAHLYDGMDPQQATERVIEEYGVLDVDEHPVFWLSLAATQLEYGRLVDGVKARALDVIRSGEDLARWDGAKRRARVLAELARKLEGPQKPPKKLPKRPPKLQQGDVFRLPLDDGRYGFGRVLTDTERAFYRFTSAAKRPPLDDIIASEVLFVVGSTDDGFAKRKWFVIGNRPLEERLRKPIHFSHHAVGDAYCTVYDIWNPGHEERRPVSECDDIERWGAWSSHHCRDRIVDTLAGVECKWMRALR